MGGQYRMQNASRRATATPATRVSRSAGRRSQSRVPRRCLVSVSSYLNRAHRLGMTERCQCSLTVRVAPLGTRPRREFHSRHIRRACGSYHQPVPGGSRPLHPHADVFCRAYMYVVTSLFLFHPPQSCGRALTSHHGQPFSPSHTTAGAAAAVPSHPGLPLAADGAQTRRCHPYDIACHPQCPAAAATR